MEYLCDFGYLKIQRRMRETNLAGKYIIPNCSALKVDDALKWKRNFQDKYIHI